MISGSQLVPCNGDLKILMQPNISPVSFGATVETDDGPRYFSTRVPEFSDEGPREVNYSPVMFYRAVAALMKENLSRSWVCSR
jgi:hypothetical protein